MVPAKVAFDQTVWASIWNSIYYVVLGCLRFESTTTIFGELKSTFWPMLTVRNPSASSFHVWVQQYFVFLPQTFFFLLLCGLGDRSHGIYGSFLNEKE